MNKKLLGKFGSSWLTGIVAVILVGLTSTASAAPPFKGPIGPIDVQGDFVADCGEFAVLGNFTFAGHFIQFFDKGGVTKRVNVHLAFTNSVYYGVNYDDPNLEFGYAEPEVFLVGGPGEGENDKQIFVDGELTEIKVTGMPYKLTVPGYGVIFHDGGQIIFAFPSFEILFQAGPSDFTDGEIDALCAAIQPIEYDNGG